MSESTQPSPKTVSLHAVVRGYVQGVGFRDFVYTRARFLGVRGYVRNLDDLSSVEVVAEGEREQLEQLLEYLRQGPRGSRVQEVDAQWGEDSGRFTRFGVAF